MERVKRTRGFWEMFKVDLFLFDSVIEFLSEVS